MKTGYRMIEKLKRLDKRIFGGCEHRWEETKVTYSGQPIFRESGFKHHFKCHFCGKRIWRYPRATPSDSIMW